MHVVEKIGFNAVFRQDSRRRFGEHVRLSPRVVGNHDAPLYGFRAQLFDKLREPLCRAHDGIDVHHIHAVADNAAHARRSEFQFSAESVFLGLFVGSDRFELRSPFLRKAGIGQPCLIIFPIIHILFLFDFDFA